MKACFDFARIIGSAVSYDLVPYESLIQSISAILSEDRDGLSVFRYSIVVCTQFLGLADFGRAHIQIQTALSSVSEKTSGIYS